MSPLTTLDLTALQDSWEQVDFEEDGVRHAPDEYRGAITTFTGNSFMVCTTEGTILLKGAFTLDASCVPRAINWIDAIGPDAGKELLAIYRLDSGRFAFVASDAGAPRPTGFCTTLGQTMRTFIRRN